MDDLGFKTPAGWWIVGDSTSQDVGIILIQERGIPKQTRTVRMRHEDVLCNSLCLGEVEQSWVFQRCQAHMGFRHENVCVLHDVYPGQKKSLKAKLPDLKHLLSGSSQTNKGSTSTISARILPVVNIIARNVRNYKTSYSWNERSVCLKIARCVHPWNAEIWWNSAWNSAWNVVFPWNAHGNLMKFIRGGACEVPHSCEHLAAVGSWAEELGISRPIRNAEIREKWMNPIP